jgi:hypothetical protein
LQGLQRTIGAFKSHKSILIAGIRRQLIEAIDGVEQGDGLHVCLAALRRSGNFELDRVAG